MSDLAPVAPIFLVDARNCMYRAIYASKRGRPGEMPTHPFVIMLRMISSWMSRYNPAMVQVFWDAPKTTLWRRKLLETYKERDNNNYIAPILPDLEATQLAARATFEHLNVYQFYQDCMEADDLIYAACRVQCGRPMVIFSTDSDMLQIQYTMPNVRVYHPEHGRELDTPECNPAFQKALMGDDSDCVGGFDQIGPKRSAGLLSCPKKLGEFLKGSDMMTYIRNLILIDLGLCPHLLQNMLYVGRVLALTPCFNRGELYRLERELKLVGLSPDYATIAAPFGRLPNK